MIITELNFLFIGRCLGYSVENPALGKLLHKNEDIDWHTKVYDSEFMDFFVIEEAFLNTEDCKWDRAYYMVKKGSFNWNIEKEGSEAYKNQQEQIENYEKVRIN